MNLKRSMIRLVFGGLKQRDLLLRALKERGMGISPASVTIDHERGVSVIDGHHFGIVYPDSFFERTKLLVTTNKSLTFYFNGNMRESGGRPEMLSPFRSLADSSIVESNRGRIRAIKGAFNRNYFRQLAQAKFGLCPHQIDWNGPRDALWTYRFIECCMVGTIPVLFREAPLSKSFVDGFHYFWDDRAYQLAESGKLFYDADLACANRAICEERFALPETWRS